MTAEWPEEGRCPQAWHTGLHSALLVECRYVTGHKGWHRNALGTLQWGGKLTPAERVIAAKLRQQAAA